MNNRPKSYGAQSGDFTSYNTNVILELSRSHPLTIRLQNVYSVTQYTDYSKAFVTVDDARVYVISLTPVGKVQSYLSRFSRNS